MGGTLYKHTDTYILARTLAIELSYAFCLCWFDLIRVELGRFELSFWLPLDPLLSIYWFRCRAWPLQQLWVLLSLFALSLLLRSICLFSLRSWHKCVGKMQEIWADITVYAVNIVKCFPVCVCEGVTISMWVTHTHTHTHRHCVMAAALVLQKASSSCCSYFATPPKRAVKWERGRYRDRGQINFTFMPH